MSLHSHRRRQMRQTRKATVREALGHKPAPDVVEAVFLNPRLQALREIIREAGGGFYRRHFSGQSKRTVEQMLREHMLSSHGTPAEVLRLKRRDQELARRILATDAHRQSFRQELERIGRISEKPDDFFAFLHKHLPRLIEAERIRTRKNNSAYETDPRYRVGVLVLRSIKPPASGIQSALAEAQEGLNLFEGCRLAAQEAHIRLRPVHSVFLERRIKFYQDWKALLQRLPRMPLAQLKELQVYTRTIEK